MARWRPPPPKSSPYITKDGYQRLEAEAKALWEKRSDVTRAITAAAAEGDRSENAEYIYRKKQLREIDARIRYLQKRMPKLTVVTEVGDTNKIFFGAEVTLEDRQEQLLTYRIVGPDEIDSDKSHISIDSPMARALLGKAVDDDIVLRIESGEMEYIITSIRYSS